MFRLNKNKIFFLYRYYLLSQIIISDETNETKKKKVLIWWENCSQKEEYIRDLITKKTKNKNKFFFSPLKQATLVYGVYEILTQSPNYTKMIIDQVVNFSKTYLDENDYKYVNKILDLITKEKITFSD